ncbi:MAG TPA: 1-acyl-sn-glycerol-3-phosphate acyltransferase, partial [Leptospiraceae bacterium]|nr:1-acyl-sn-glycerol-3-phosphate acyltransferase [Leptospiraceae bacterium]
MPGIAQIGFWGLEDARKKDPNADIKVLPAFVKYLLSGDENLLYKEIETSIEAIERKLKINPGNKNLLRRFLTVGRILLEDAEREYGISPITDKDYDYRVGAIRHAALNRAAEKLGIKFDPNEDAIHKIREVFTVLDGIHSGLGKQQVKISRKDLEIVQKDVDRAYLFLVIKQEYLLAYPTAERFIEWLYRFENLIFGVTKPRARRARVVIAKPFGLGEYYDSYKENKKKTIEDVTARLRKDIEGLLKDCIPLSKPIVTPFDVGEDLKS